MVFVAGLAGLAGAVEFEVKFVVVDGEFVTIDAFVEAVDGVLHGAEFALGDAGDVFEAPAGFDHGAGGSAAAVAPAEAER